MPPPAPNPLPFIMESTLQRLALDIMLRLVRVA